jgi:dynein heavy chain
MRLLVEKLDAAQSKKKNLEDEFNLASKKLNRAKELIVKLKDEEVNWAKSLELNRAFKECLVGDIIISSGIIAYLGVFTSDYRKDAINNWVQLMK